MSEDKDVLWKSIFTFFSEVLEAPVKPSPNMAIFGVAEYDISLNSSAKNCDRICQSYS